MFGMGDNKKKKIPDWNFDMENDLKNPSEYRKMQEVVAARVQGIKQVLRAGEDKQAFEQTQTVLDGFLAVQKVINRLNRK